jgi:hypothetical protein
MDQTFDPFTDRTARDIRNSLSSALISELLQSETEAVVQVARHWQRLNVAPVYQNYIRMIRERYLLAKDDIQAWGIKEPRYQAVVLWNAGLFFELHELLETVWLSAQGAERIALKGMIQAAGAYVHSLRGKVDAAQGLAQRAQGNLRAGRERLNFIANLDLLLKSLEQPSQPPPQLVLARISAAG